MQQGWIFLMTICCVRVGSRYAKISFIFDDIILAYLVLSGLSDAWEGLVSLRYR